MNDRTTFNPLQAQQVAEAFNAAGVDYLFLGKSGAILLGYPGTTQDVDLYPARSEDNGRRMVAALQHIGFALDESTQRDILLGRDFVQLKNGPFDLDLVFAPVGIDDYATALRRYHLGLAVNRPPSQVSGQQTAGNIPSPGSNQRPPTAAP